jgi:3-oxoacyl-[acyl-carrier protein] reductase
LLDLELAHAWKVADELDPTRKTAIAVGADVRSSEQLEEAISQVTAHWHSPDVLVNNAARTVFASVWDISVDEWDDVLATNLRSVFVATRLCAPAMRQNGWGRIVNMASYAGQQGGVVAGAHYSASKAGILVLTKIFARELAKDGVTVNAVAPTSILTPVMDELPPEKIASSAAAIPVGRLGTPDEVGAMVSYLCGKQSGYVTGATFDINGGVFMR